MLELWLQWVVGERAGVGSICGQNTRLHVHLWSCPGHDAHRGVQDPTGAACPGHPCSNRDVPVQAPDEPEPADCVHQPEEQRVQLGAGADAVPPADHEPAGQSAHQVPLTGMPWPAAQTGVAGMRGGRHGFVGGYWRYV